MQRDVAGNKKFSVALVCFRIAGCCVIIGSTLLLLSGATLLSDLNSSINISGLPTRVMTAKIFYSLIALPHLFVGLLMTLAPGDTLMNCIFLYKTV